MSTTGCILVAVLVALCNGAMPPPPYTDQASTARWLVHNANYGVLATISVHLNGRAFGNIASISDGTLSPDNSTGVPYFYVSALDTSMQDVAINPNVSLTLSEQQVSAYCSNKTLDPEDPRCARLVWFIVNILRQTNDRALTYY